MLILPWEIYTTIPTSQSIHDWPGLRCLWTNASGLPENLDLAKDSLIMDFNPRPPCMMEGLRLTILKCLTFRHKIVTPILCATRIPTEEEMLTLHGFATHEPDAVKTVTPDDDELVFIGSGIVGGSEFPDALRRSGPLADGQQGLSLFSTIPTLESEVRE